METLRLTLRRIALRDTYTIGKLYIDGKYFCDTCEDKVRDINKNGVFDNGEQKVMHETAIPYGTYKIVMDQKSPRFASYRQYAFCKGYLPRLCDVPSFDGVLIHIGNTAKDSSGCILVGKNTKVGAVMESTVTFTKLYEILKKAWDFGKNITITIE